MFDFQIETNLGIRTAAHKRNITMFTKLSSILSTLTTAGSPKDFPYVLNTENEEVVSLWHCSTATRNVITSMFSLLFYYVAVNPTIVLFLYVHSLMAVESLYYHVL